MFQALDTIVWIYLIEKGNWFFNLYDQALKFWLDYFPFTVLR